MPWMTIPIALGMAAAGSGAASVYATKRSGDINRRSIEAGERSDTRAAELERARLAAEERARQEALAEERRWREEQARLEREREARRERLYQEAVGRDRERWQDYLKVWQPHWQAGAGVLGNLYDIAGVSGANPAAAAASMPITTPPPSGGAPPIELSPGGDGVWGRRSAADLMTTGPSRTDAFSMPARRPSVLPRVEMPRANMMSLTDLMALGSSAAALHSGPFVR